MNRRIHPVGVLAIVAAVLLVPQSALTHCDSLDGPVVTDAKAALEQKDVTPVLKWVPKDDEAEVERVFQQTLIVRAAGPEARDLADRHFFETVVRLHRIGEGAAYTGLKPAGTPISPAVVRADQALEDGNVEALASRIAAAVQRAIEERFAAAHAAAEHKDQSTETGRQFVESYVEFVHFVEHIHAALSHDGHDAGHGH